MAKNEDLCLIKSYILHESDNQAETRKMYDDKIMTVTGLFALHTPECGRTPARSRENYVTTGDGLTNGGHCGL